MLNRQGKNKIDYVDFTWNPISGCKHACPYCYCNRLAKRFGKDFKKYKFREHYLKDLIKNKKVKDGDKIFVGSSGDMFGDWVSKDDIQRVLDICGLIKNKDLTFIFLTKNPKRYFEFKFPENCWLGISIDTNARLEKYCKDLEYLGIKNNRFFISFEPLLEKIDLSKLNKLMFIDWYIIGANSNVGAEKPLDKWADEIISELREYGWIAIWVKDNYQYHTRIKEYPKIDNE